MAGSVSHEKTSALSSSLIDQFTQQPSHGNEPHSLSEDTCAAGARHAQGLGTGATVLDAVLWTRVCGPIRGRLCILGLPGTDYQVDTKS